MPTSQTMCIAEGRCGRLPQRRGRDRLAPPPGAAALRGAVLSRFLPLSVAEGVDAGRDRFAAAGSGRRFAGTDYPAVVEGERTSCCCGAPLPGTTLLVSSCSKRP